MTCDKGIANVRSVKINKKNEKDIWRGIKWFSTDNLCVYMDR